MPQALWIQVMSSVHLYVMYDKHYITLCLAEAKVALLPAYHYPYPQLGGQGTQHASAHTHSWDEL